MMEWDLQANGNKRLSVLCLGAHSDDIEIGCGGTIMRLMQMQACAEFTWVVCSADRQRREEARESARLLLKDARDTSVLVKSFRESFFPAQMEQIKEFFEGLKRRCQPDIIFTHYRNDLHQDHRVISELTWNTFRNHLILEYEIPKYDGDLGQPNVFVHLDERLSRAKARHITSAFGTQKGRQWFSDDTFLAMLRIRGVESNAPGKYAEGFYCRKMIMR